MAVRSFADTPVQKAFERHRIALEGWRSLEKVAGSIPIVMVMSDSLSKREFLVVYYNGGISMSVIPKDDTAGVPAIQPTGPFKSSW
jgi:hypothetical protein